jgi:uncharacterized circularly permuted ATP-grasp superfamily protein/uncharacterized alpha-E superfamily protein
VVAADSPVPAVMDSHGVVDRYRATQQERPPAGGVAGRDEFLGSDGSTRSNWQDLAATVDLLGPAGLRARGAQARRLLEDDGVTYGVPADAGAAPGLWRLDPLPVILDSEEWAELAPGLIQRAELLDRLLADLYGPRELLQRGLIPPEVVLGHAGFIRQCDGLRLPGPNQLLMASTDLVRGPEGWCALGDRTQAPSGAGYAMENRRIVSRVMPGLYRDTLLERLRSFFQVLRAALQEVAPDLDRAPRVVILTPGAASETAFDQAFLSTLLGFPLVEGQDLTVRNGRVWIRSLGRPEPVDVVLRRVDGWFCDPLQLRADSRLGVPGLLQAARLGNVSIVNPPGSGVLENPGLVPYLPAICAALLDAPLRLPSVPTWWCGDPASRRHVLANLATLVIRPLARGIGRANRFGWELSRAELAELKDRIEAEPQAWCAQQALEMSTVPVIAGAGLEPRNLVLRSFAVASGGSFRLMAGGLARVAAQAGSLDVSSQAGALAKDVWVLGSRLVGAVSVALPKLDDEEEPAGTARAGDQALSSRVAEDMFWLGRYAERAEDATRMLRVTADLVVDHSRRPGSVGAASLAVMLSALTAVTTTYPGFLGGKSNDAADSDGSADAAAMIAYPQPELIRLTVDPFVPGTLAHAVRHTVESAQAVRELLSGDTWLVLGSLDRLLVELAQAADPALQLQPTLSRVLEGLLALSGLAMESMVRDAGWHLMDAGRRIERAIQLVSLLRHTLAERRPAAVDDLVLESVLIAAESVITYRRRHPGRPRVDDVLDLLLLDRDNPRGVQHQLDRLGDDLRQLPAGTDGPSPSPEGRLRLVQARLREVDTHEMAEARAELVQFLDGVSLALAELAELTAQTYFARPAPPQPMPATPTLDLR